MSAPRVRKSGFWGRMCAAHKLALAVCLSLGCALLFHSRARVSENILSMVPSSVRKPVELFEHSPLGQKLIVAVHCADEDTARDTALTLRAELAARHLIRPLFTPPPDFARVLWRGIAPRFSAADAARAETFLTPQETQKSLAAHYENLLALESPFFKNVVALDPFNLLRLMTDKLRALGEGTGLEFQDGLLASADGKTQIALYDAAGKSTDFNTARQMAAFFGDFQQTLPAGTRVFFLGALRYTLENVETIKRDLGVISVLALVCLGAVFGLLLRRKSALLIYALPLLVLPPAALVTALCFGEISGITLGFGSVVAGLSVDYAVYVFFALQSPQGGAAEILPQLRKHLWCNFMTSALCFAALFCSSVEVFRQIAVFSLSALALALFCALKIFPAFWEHTPALRPCGLPLRVCPLPRRWAALAAAVVLLWGVWGVKHTQFSRDMNELNSTSPAFKAEKQIAADALGAAADKQALLFVLGATSEEALMRSEILSTKTPVPLAVSALFVSARGQEQNRKRWAGFWNTNRRHYARLLLEEYAPQAGFKPEAFAPFFEEISAGAPAEDNLDLSVFYNPVLEINGAYAVMHRVQDAPEYHRLADDKNVFFFSQRALQERLMRAVKEQALQIVVLAFLFNLAAVWLVFRRLKDALLCFVPVVLGACVTFGCFALFEVRVNLFVLVFLPLLMGLGIDYGIFQVIKYNRGADATFYPPRALITAGLSTLAGFGVLAAAKHEVLFMMGFSSFTGISAAVCAALFILPAFLERGT